VDPWVSKQITCSPSCPASQEAGLHRALPSEAPSPEASLQLPPWACPLPCRGWSWAGLAAHHTGRQRAASFVRSPRSQAASPLDTLLNLQAKWTSCCRKPWFWCIKRPSADRSYQKACKHCSCRLAESHCEAARCPAKTGTSCTLRVAAFLTRAILLLARECPGTLSFAPETAQRHLVFRIRHGLALEVIITVNFPSRKDIFLFIVR